MSSYKELTIGELNHSYQPSDFEFISTDDIEGNNDFWGQKEAIETLNQSLKIEDKGYNLYICSENYERMDKVIIKSIEKIARTKKPCKACGYLYNFHCPSEPIFIELRGEVAKTLCDDLQELSAVILNDLPLLLEGKEVKKEQKAIIEEFERFKVEKFLEVSEKAKEKNLQLKLMDEGAKFIPLSEEGIPMSLKEYEELPQEKQSEINSNLEQLQDIAEETMAYLNQQEDYYYELYEEVKQQVVLKEIGSLIKRLKDKYDKEEQLKEYFNGLAEDLLNHIQLLTISASEEKEAQKEVLPWQENNVKQKLVGKYELKLLQQPLVKGVPVINDLDYPKMELSGRLLSSTEVDNTGSQLASIKPGLFHLANHGYLVLHMQNILEKRNAWQNMKDMLRTGKIMIDTNEENPLMMTQQLMPQPGEARLKIILIGSQELYEILKNYDESFKKYFKIKVNICEEMPCKPMAIKELAKTLKKIVKQEKLPTPTIEGLLRMVQYSNRKIGSVEKIEGDIDTFVDFLREARMYNKRIADKECINKVIQAREANDRSLEKRLEETIIDATYLIDTEGEKVGQINGLAVYTLGNLSCGRPIKITATTYRGQLGLVDIDGTAQLSGSIHTKGVHIITGFLGYHFAQDFPLALNCNLCFEQNYVSIDGDSASSAELYAIISSLAQLPIKQYLAVTGSMNQFGDIQPIGGVNEKIEGFFKICQLRHLKGNEGVIIPRQNTKDLLLNEEVIEAVRQNKFHIFEVSTVWDAMEILMARDRDEIKELVYQKLRQYSL